MQFKNRPAHERRCRLTLNWPVPPLRVALVEPEIPPNTGNIARLCAATGSPLHLIGPLGFRLTDAAVRRAGLDYWDAVELVRHDRMADFFAMTPPARCHFLSTGGPVSYTAVKYLPGDALVFGSESRGLPEELLAAYPDRVRAIPLRSDQVRSLNLATAAGIVLYEALRQLQAG